ncbi:MAG: ABC transporter ATP-binding protein [Lachnospiraceae bacterium]
METVVKAEDLVKHYGAGGNITKAVDHVNLEIKRGKFTAIMGRSGSGKSTLLHLLGGLDRPGSGKVYIEGQDISKFNSNELAKFRREKIGFIFQDYNLVPSLTVWENIILPLGLSNIVTDVNKITNLLDKTGLSDKKDAMPDTLSGGQKQRCAIARALATEPAIILADEPTGNLDSQTEAGIMGLLKQSVEEYNQTLVMITHDEGIAHMADIIYFIEDGKVVDKE